MRRSSMAWFPLAVSLPLVLGACGGEPVAEAPPGGVETAGEAGPAAAAAPRPDTTRMYMVRLDGLRRPDLIGSAGFVPAGDQTLVIAGVRGADAGGTLQGHLHRGETCDAPGEAAIPLEDISVGADGLGRSTTTVPASIGTVFDGDHLLVYHQGDGEPGQAVICGDIPVLVPLTEEGASPPGS